jgi:multiple sugar transport system ATP-binding protein
MITRISASPPTILTTETSHDGSEQLEPGEAPDLPCLYDRLSRSPSDTRKARSPAVVVGGRHSTIRLVKGALPQGAVQGVVYAVEPTGDSTFVHVKLGSAMLVVSVTPDFRLSPDEAVGMVFDQDRLHFFDGASGQALPVA